MEIFQAMSDIGLYRDINEDYAFCCTHPKNELVKLMVIADGMGGKKQGDIASQETAAALEAWFYHADFDILKDIDGVYEILDKKVHEINTYLIKKYGENFLGTTLTLALIGFSKTLFYNIGDSRGYIYKNREVRQITDDDSGVWEYHKKYGIVKDDLRFFPTNNLITACVGLNEDLCRSRYYILDNTMYDGILLVSDGVSDLLADKDIKKVLDSKDRKKILRDLLDVAVRKDLRLKVPGRLKNKYNMKFSIPMHGRDNASGVLYLKD